MERPASLDAVGVRAGGEWLARGTLHEDARLGSLTQVVRRKNGELAMVGTHAAVFWTAADAQPRVVTFRDPAGAAELVSGPADRRATSTGAGWVADGALIGEDGVRLWQPDRLAGMDDMAAGDLDGDGIPEIVVGYNGGSGVHLYDAAGKPRWRKLDGNVWHVEILDTDGDGHGDPPQQRRGATHHPRGQRQRARTRQPAAYLSVLPVEWPRGRWRHPRE
jgi:hypothetical protein